MSLRPPGPAMYALTAATFFLVAIGAISFWDAATSNRASEYTETASPVGIPSPSAIAAQTDTIFMRTSAAPFCNHYQLSVNAAIITGYRLSHENQQIYERVRRIPDSDAPSWIMESFPLPIYTRGSNSIAVESDPDPRQIQSADIQPVFEYEIACAPLPATTTERPIIKSGRVTGDAVVDGFTLTLDANTPFVPAQLPDDVFFSITKFLDNYAQKGFTLNQTPHIAHFTNSPLKHYVTVDPAREIIRQLVQFSAPMQMYLGDLQEKHIDNLHFLHIRVPGASEDMPLYVTYRSETGHLVDRKPIFVAGEEEIQAVSFLIDDRELTLIGLHNDDIFF